MIKKLKRQFIAINMILVLLVIVPTFTYMYTSTANNLARSSYMAIEEGLGMFTGPKDGKNIPKDLENKRLEKPQFEMPKEGEFGEENDPQRNFFNTFFVTLDSAGNVLETVARSSYEIADEDLQTIIDSVTAQGSNKGVVNELGIRYIIRNYTNSDGVDVTTIGFMDISYEKNILSTQKTMYIGIGFVVLAVFFIISILLSKRVMKPIEKSWNQQQQFVSDVSHELKTPTAVILANASILKMNDELGEDRKWVDYISIEAERMKNLIEKLLFLSKSDFNKSEYIFSTVQFGELVFGSTLPYEAVLFENGKNVTLSTKIEDNCTVLGDEGQLKQLVNILIDNAVKYSLGNSEIKVTLNKESKNNKNYIALRVNNKSEVISDEDLEKIFQRFYKVDKARTRENESYGLGLSIAKEVVLNHKGKISVKSSKEEGTTFKVLIPRV